MERIDMDLLHLAQETFSYLLNINEKLTLKEFAARIIDHNWHQKTFIIVDELNKRSTWTIEKQWDRVTILEA